MDLIYCGHRNPQLAEIAIEEGWLYGSQPSKVKHKVSFCDLDYKRCDNAYLDRYARFVQCCHPKYATVPDLFSIDDVDNVLRFAEERIANYVEVVIVIPKVSGVLADIPQMIGRSKVILGYSTPTRYGATSVPALEFAASGRQIHLLGGSPKKQMELYRYLPVVSADGNMMLKMATTRCLSWSAKSQNFERVADLGLRESFRWSCREIYQAWKDTCALNP